MKIRLWFFLALMSCVVWQRLACADSTSELLEPYPTGSINWTIGVVTASGCVALNTADQSPDHGIEFDNAFQLAVHNLRATIAMLRMDSENRISDLLVTHSRTQDKIWEMTAAAKVVSKERTPAGGFEVTLEMSLYGGFAQLTLPSDIRQVESVKPLNGNGKSNPGSSRSDAAGELTHLTETGAYSGLLVDARGIGASPSMVPVLVDENDQEVYGPAYVSREYAVQHGMCRYIRGSENYKSLPRVAPNPLIVKGLRTVSVGSCNIVISNSDASRLRGVSSHLEFLKQCRVIIIID